MATALLRCSTASLFTPTIHKQTLLVYIPSFTSTLCLPNHVYKPPSTKKPLLCTPTTGFLFPPLHCMARRHLCQKRTTCSGFIYLLLVLIVRVKIVKKIQITFTNKIMLNPAYKLFLRSIELAQCRWRINCDTVPSKMNGNKLRHF